MTLRMTLSQGPLENLYRLTLLRGADVAEARRWDDEAQLTEDCWR
jgi:hypothetical protein